MKRYSVQHAYENIHPDDAAKERMLNQILLSSEISPAGKDEVQMRKKMKPFVIAAIITIMIFLMGCTVVVLGSKDFVIGERPIMIGEILDSEGNVIKRKEVIGEVISLHGIINSPTYLAHQEWYQFYSDYSVNHEITTEENFFIPPEEYEAYTAYNQELMDKIDEIVQKYNLNLLGAFAPFQEWECEVFFTATGVKNLLVSDSLAVIDGGSGYFYQAGNFKIVFDMTMPKEDGCWPYRMLNSIYYSKADNFDTVGYTIWNPQNWEEWNYTTSTGAELLIIRSKSVSGAHIMCVREDAIVNVTIEDRHTASDGTVMRMTKRQLEQVAEQFDYSVKVEHVDMELAKSNLAKFTNNAFMEESDPAEYGSFDQFIQARILEQGSGSDKEFYSLADINEDGVEDLIVGSADEIRFVWMMKYDQMCLIMDYGYAYRDLKEAWPDMDKKPVTEYFSDPAKRDKYGYQRYVMEVLSMEHPENTLFVLSDINDDGTLELLIGDEQILSYVYRVTYSKSGYPNIGVLSYSFTEEEWNELREAWANMDRKPITEYFSE